MENNPKRVLSIGFRCYSFCVLNNVLGLKKWIDTLNIIWWLEETGRADRFACILRRMSERERGKGKSAWTIEAYSQFVFMGSNSDEKQHKRLYEKLLKCNKQQQRRIKIKIIVKIEDERSRAYLSREWINETMKLRSHQDEGEWITTDTHTHKIVIYKNKHRQVNKKRLFQRWWWESRPNRAIEPI